MHHRRALRRREFALGVALALAGSVGAGGVGAAAAAPAFDYGTAIDVAGRQRMLTQRIVKAYCQAGLGVATETSRAQLADAVQRFDAQLGELTSSAPNETVRRALARCATLWRPFRRLAAGRASRTGARALAERGERLLAAAHAVVLALQSAAGTPQARLVNVSGRQRMLSQRLAMLYMLRAWEVHTPSLRERTDSAAHEFAAALLELRGAGDNTAEISKELDEVAVQWEWFSGALELQGAQSYTLVVADASEQILQRMERVTAMYAELARR